MSVRPPPFYFREVLNHMVSELRRRRRPAVAGPGRPFSAAPALLVGLVAAFAAGAAGAQAEAPAPIPVSPAPASPPIALDEVHPGQRGYGLSVFSGTEPERFDVEVLGVLRNSSPEMSYILARLSGHDLERAGVVAGMSGSPVYLDDRLAGAVAFGYLFGLDAIAGITPIGAMRRLSAVEDPPSPAVAQPAAHLELADLVHPPGDPAAVLRAALATLRPGSLLGGSRSALQWSAAGFGAPALGLLEETLGPLAPMGAAGLRTAASMPASGAVDTAGPELAPGSAVAAILVQGDLNLAVHGTVTDRTGDEILAFGHPVFEAGPIRLPMAGSEVVTVIANRASSFKMANSGRVVGAFDQDREAGARGRLGLVAPTIPVAVTLQGQTAHRYAMEVAEMPELTPTLIALTALGAVSSGTYAAGRQGLDLEATFHLRGYDDLVVRQSFDGDQAVIQAVVHLFQYARFLQANDLERVAIDRVEITIDQAAGPRLANLVGAHPLRSRVAPGETVPVLVELQAYRGERYRREIAIEVPEHVPDGRYYVLLGDGTSMDAARLAIERPSPLTFAQSLRLLRSFQSRRELQAFGLVPATGVAVGGEVLPQLPGSVRSLFAGRGAGGSVELPWTVTGRSVETLDRPITGLLRVDLEVRRRGV